MSIAELLDYGLKEVPQQAEIRTETIETNNATTDSSRVFKYTIRNVGFLEGTSMLTFKLKKLTGTDGNFRLNLWNGALSCIKNAVLRIGDYEVQNVQDVDKISTLFNMNQSVLQRRNVLGHYLGNSLELLVADQADPERDASTDATGLGQIQYDAVNSGVSFGKVADGGAGTTIAAGVSGNIPVAAPNSLSIVAADAKNEKYGIPLSMIFPCLKGRSLPLFLFTDYNIQLEFEMNFPDKYAYDLSQDAAEAQAGADYMAEIGSVGFSNVQLVIDYMLPPSSVINNYMAQTEKQGGYRFEFPEVAVVKKKLNSVPRSKELQEVEHRLGQTGKEIHHIVMTKQFVDAKNKSGSVITANGVTTAGGASITSINCENIAFGAVVPIQAGVLTTAALSVVAVDVAGQKVTLSAGTNMAANAGGADIQFINPPAQGLGRKILQSQSIDGIDEEEYNCEVNGLDIFPQFVYNNASQYNQMSLVLDGDLIVPRTMYYTDPNAQHQRLAPLDDGLTSNYKPLGVDLRNGNGGIVGGGTTIMSGSPLIWKYKRKPRMNGSGDGTDATANAKGHAIDYRREMDVSYYITHSRVVIVKKLAKGTSVMVSS